MATSVLVIEDNPADFRLLQEALFDVDAFEIELTPVETLGAALDRLKTERFDVILLDLSLPDTDGLHGLKRIQESASELPILVLTGRDDSELAIRAMREGAQDYLVKGQVDGHLLVRAMRYAEERKRGIQQLKRSEERFRSLLENALDIILVLDAEGRITYTSPSVERVLGYTPDELSGIGVTSLLHPDDITRVEAAIQRMQNWADADRVECRARHRNGGWRVLDAISRTVLNDPALTGIVVNARDITERKDAEERLRETNERLRAVIETSPLSILMLDPKGRVLGWNRAAQQTFGWNEAEVLNKEPPILQPQTRDWFHRQLQEARDGRTFPQIDGQLVRKDGGLIDVSVWTSPLRSENGQFRGLLAVIADVTERRRLEEQFRQAQKMEAIGRLAGGVAHDFNNLLTVITGYSQLASNRISADSQASSDLREVLQAADRAASLTRQLLALSRRQVVEPAVLDLNAVVSNLERMFMRILGEDIYLGTRLDPTLSSVRADRGQIELVLLNLVVNARDAMPGGGRLTIETANVDLDPDEAAARSPEQLCGRCVMLAISDTGTGMDAEVRAHLFEPFFTTKEPGKGTGLGLSTSYGIVRQHGGEIIVNSEPGVGTVFKVHLPVSDDDPAPQPAAPKVVDARGTETILLVEDDPSVAKVMREALEINGYRVLLTNDPQAATEVARDYSSPIDLLLSDMVLQGSHGVDLAQQIRGIRPEIRVLFVSGYTGEAAPGQLFLESVPDFLQKPFAPEVLAAKVRQVLNR